MTTLNNEDPADPSVHEHADDGLPEPVAHMYPSDLKKFESSEMSAPAFSVAVGNPDERSAPLYTADQMRSAIAAEHERVIHWEEMARQFIRHTNFWRDKCREKEAELSTLREQLAEAVRERDGWKAAAWKCRGIPDANCGYLAHCHTPCNKCGRLHGAANGGGDAIRAATER